MAKETKAAKAKHTLEEVREMAAELGYELRKKGVHRDKHNETDADGNPVKNCFMPHWRITASGKARSCAVMDEAKAQYGFAPDLNGECWEQKLLLILEHAVRYHKHRINDSQMLAALRKLENPLPKDEYVRELRKRGLAPERSGKPAKKPAKKAK